MHLLDGDCEVTIIEDGILLLGEQLVNIIGVQSGIILSKAEGSKCVDMN